jgi:autotransporter adhesin
MTGTGQVVSVGNATAGGQRQIQNVAAGAINATSTQAINGSELYSVSNTLGTIISNQGNTTASGLGGGSTYNVTTGNVSAPSYTINGGSYNSVGAAMTAINGNLTHFYSVNNTTTTAGNYYNNGATAANALAAGVGTTASAANSTAMGSFSAASLAGSVALGNNSTTTAGANVTSATIGSFNYTGFAGTMAGTGQVVSVGNATAGGQRQIQNVAAGAINATSTQAINGSELYSVASSLGNAITNITNITGIHFFSVNNTTATAGNYNNTGATAANAIAIGPNASAGGAYSVVMGYGAGSGNTGVSNLALGNMSGNVVTGNQPA